MQTVWVYSWENGQLGLPTLSLAMTPNVTAWEAMQASRLTKAKRLLQARSPVSGGPQAAAVGWEHDARRSSTHLSLLGSATM